MKITIFLLAMLASQVAVGQTATLNPLWGRDVEYQKVEKECRICGQTLIEYREYSYNQSYNSNMPSWIGNNNYGPPSVPDSCREMKFNENLTFHQVCPACYKRYSYIVDVVRSAWGKAFDDAVQENADNRARNAELRRLFKKAEAQVEIDSLKKRIEELKK